MIIKMDIPGLKDMIIEKLELVEDSVVLHISMPKQVHLCPGENTVKGQIYLNV